MSLVRPLLVVGLSLTLLFSIAAYLNSLLAQAPPIDNRLPTPYVAPRGPDPNKIPSYPGAHDVQTRFGVSMRQTTYLVAAEPKDIESYYRRELPPLGWLNDSASKTIDSSSGLLFVYALSTDPAHRLAGGYATITATILPQGLTEVVIRVFGDGIDMPNEP
jgi:hypothetical protein